MGVEVVLVIALCEGGYRCGFASCGVWPWPVSLRMLRCGLLAGFWRGNPVKTRNRVFLLNNIDMPDSPISPSIEASTEDRGIVTLPSLLASPEEKRAHQLRRFESWL